MRTISTPDDLNLVQPAEVTLAKIRAGELATVDGVVVRDGCGDVFQRDLEDLHQEGRYGWWFAMGTDLQVLTTGMTFPVEIIWEPK